MSVDERGQSAVLELSAATRAISLPRVSDVRGSSMRRQRARVGSTAVVCAALLSVGLLSATRITAATEAPPASVPTPTASATFGLACQFPGISCSAGRIRASGDLLVPLSFVPTAGLNTDDIAPGGTSLTVRRTQGGRVSGITVLERPVAVDGVNDRDVVALLGADAATTASWLATRPFALPTAAQPTEVGGLPAYRVDLTLRPGADLPSFALGHAAGVTFVTVGDAGRDATTAVSQELSHTTYYLVDLPGHGLVVTWVWSIGGSADDVASMGELVRSLRFG